MIKVDLITGFLGAGKTTFIIQYAKYLLSQGMRIAIIENDFGAINVDRLILQQAFGDDFDDAVQLEMVIGGNDLDCHRRRLKTKLITMGMEGYDYVLVEPSGIFDVEEFFDLLYEEPLDRWYQIGNVISIVDAKAQRNLSGESEYILASQLAKAGKIVLSKKQDVSEEETAQIVNYLNRCLADIGCERVLSDKDIFSRDWEHMIREDFRELQNCGYSGYEYVKQRIVEDGEYNSLFFFHVRMPLTRLKDTIVKIFGDETCGNVFRIKGYVPETCGWLEVNATRQEISVKDSVVGQEVFIVIGENLDEHAIARYWENRKEQ